MKLWRVFVPVFLMGMLLVAGCSSSSVPDEIKGEQVTLFKSSSCGCCGAYSQYMKTEGFEVTVKTENTMDVVKERYNIPFAVQSCHTSMIGNYFVEGHIPTEAVVKLLQEKPDIAGIALPGMPSGTPGMPGAKDEPWVIQAVHYDGSTSEFMRI